MPEPFKNNFNEAAIRGMADHFTRVAANFDGPGFIARGVDGLDGLELKGRSDHIVDAMEAYLPDSFPAASEILVASLAPMEDLSDGKLVEGVSTRGLRGWPIMPMADYIARCGQGHLALALDALKAMTPRFSSEFAIRPFLHDQTEATLDVLMCWAQEGDEHVRRLASEGTRPRLPWGMQLTRFVADPTPVVTLLEHLKDDPSEYVRRSVANNLNDIAKDHPECVVDIARRWMNGASNDRQRLIRHGLRTLIKAGHPGALDVLGYGPAALMLERFEISTPKITLGETVTFELEFKSTSPTDQPLIIDYAVHHVRAGGKMSAKVFKWKTTILKAGAVFAGSKRHPIKPITTRRYYAGQHRVEILINGQSISSAEFDLSLE